MNTRAKGNRFENKVADYLEAKGYLVSRQRRSKFPDHIVITPEGDIMLVEDKSDKYGLSKLEKEKLLALAKKYHAKAYRAYPKYSVYAKEPDNIVVVPL